MSLLSSMQSLDSGGLGDDDGAFAEHTAVSFSRVPTASGARAELTRARTPQPEVLLLDEDDLLLAPTPLPAEPLELDTRMAPPQRTHLMPDDPLPAGRSLVKIDEASRAEAVEESQSKHAAAKPSPPAALSAAQARARARHRVPRNYNVRDDGTEGP
jgi:hypothetical protein